MMALLLAFSGCSAEQGKDPAEPGNSGNQEDPSEPGNFGDQEDPSDQKDGDDAEHVSDASDPEGPGTEQDASEQEDGYQSIVFDRTRVEGKLACYFLRSDSTWTTWSTGVHAGDSILFIAPDGATMLYDCNTPDNAAYIVYALQQLGIQRLDYVVISHPHIDHIGGFSILARYMEIGQLYTPPAYVTEAGSNKTYYAAMLSKAKALGIEHSYLVEGDTFDFGGVQVQVYNPPADFDYSAGIDLNECSLLLKLTYQDSSFLAGGDCGNNLAELGRATEDELVEKYGGQLQADVAKVNHHMDSSSTYSMSEGWMNAVNAKIYVGSMNSVEELTYFRVKKTGASVFHTALDGTVLVYTTGDGTYDVQVERDRVNDYYGSLDTENGHMRVK